MSGLGSGNMVTPCQLGDMVMPCQLGAPQSRQTPGSAYGLFYFSQVDISGLQYKLGRLWREPGLKKMVRPYQTGTEQEGVG